MAAGIEADLEVIADRIVRAGREPEQRPDRRHRRRGERGQSLVEFTLLAPVLILGLLGMAEIGNALNSYLRELGASVLYTSEVREMHSPDTLPTDEVSLIVDNVLLLTYLRERHALRAMALTD